jgi:hypothetical protein
VSAADYTYHDASGAHVYTVRRRVVDGRKVFSQHRPDGTPGIDRIERVPYRLPELLSACAANVDVWIVEGEKDADRARTVGLCATTSSGGAGSWRAAHTGYLAGASWVYVVADSDVPGYRHVAVIVEQVRRMHPGLGVTVCRARFGNDLSDHLDAGFAVDDLVEVDEVMLLAQFAKVSTPRGSAELPLGRPRPPGPATTKGSAYFLATVANRIAEIRGLANGTRNRGLHDAAFAVGAWSHIVDGATSAAAFDELVGVGVDIGLTAAEARTAVKSGFVAGVANPKAQAS